MMGNSPIELPLSKLSRFMNHKVGLSMETVDKLCECLRLQLVAEGTSRKPKGD